MEERFLRFDCRQSNQANLLRILGRFGDPRKLRLLYISTYRPNYTRTESLLSLFSRTDLHVKAVLLGHSRLKHIKAVRDLIRYGSRCDLVFVAFRGQEILPILRIFTRIPIIFDAFVSVYDTLCFDGLALDNPANQDLFVEGDLVHFVEMTSPEALASKIAELTQEPTRGTFNQGRRASKTPD